MGKLPKDALPGEEHTIVVEGKGGKKRLVTFKKTEKKGFGAWKIIANKPAE